MAKNAPKTAPAVVEQEAVNNITVNAAQGTPVIETVEEIVDSVEAVEEVVDSVDTVEEIAVPAETAAEEVVDTDTDRIAEQDAVNEAVTEDQQELNTDSNEEQINPETGEEPQVEDSVEAEEVDPELKYDFSAKVLEEYLSSYKAEDKIIQQSLGGNFVSNRDHAVYVPLSLFIK
jgi:hypothetical protein